MTRCELRKWAREQNWWPKFVANFEIERGQGSFAEFVSVVDDDWGAEIISGGFFWHRTPEGGDFWREISGIMHSMR